MMKVEITVNGASTSADVEPRLLLAHYLRDVVGLKATNIGCDTTSCGACTVLLDGESVKSCTLLAAQADGAVGHHARRALGRGRRAAPGGGGVPRRARPAVRLLHAGHGDGGGRPAHREPEAHRARGPRGAGGQPLPLHGLPQHRARGDRRVRAGSGRRAGRGDPPRRRRRWRRGGAGLLDVAGSTSAAGAAHDPRRLRLRTARHARRRARAAGRARRRRQGARRRPLAAAGDEAAARRARAADRHRAARRAALRRASTATSSPSARAPGTTTLATSDVVAAPRRRCWRPSRARSATRRCATAARSAARSRTPTRPPTCPPPCWRSAARSSCAGRAGSGRCRSTEFFTGLFSTALEPDELVVEIRVPRTGSAGWAYEKFTRRANDWAIVGGRGRRRAGGAGQHGLDARCGRRPPRPRWRRARRSPDAAALADQDTDPPSDLAATPAYRRHLARVLTRRALTTAAEAG